jgi:KDO2-lipid IV(A) lauroyltransferase
VDRWIYYLIRILFFPFNFLPLFLLRFFGKILGTLGFYLLAEYRKRALSNLALADDLALTPKEIKKYAKKSFQNLAINCLEYPKLFYKKDLSGFIRCVNPEIANAIQKQGQGIIFFCAHQANWEVLFLDGTSRMKGIAIGKPIKNKYLYNWIVSIREKNGGKMILPRDAVRAGLRALKKGEFLGVVGDEALPHGGYSFSFLGRRAWFSTAPALLAYKTNSPLIFASAQRASHGYLIHYSDPIYPNQAAPLDKEVVRMMDKILSQLEASIKKKPTELLWQHNRWKQQTIHNLYRRFRQDCICIILEEKTFTTFLPHLTTIKEIYPLVFLHLIIPEKYKDIPLIEAEKVIYYKNMEETLLYDFRFKLVFNFTDYQPIHKHYKRLSALYVLDPAQIKACASEHLLPHHNFSDILKRALCKPNTIWKKEPSHAS